MAGSRSYRNYNSTQYAGVTFTAEVDESNARATYNGQELMPTSTGLGIPLPRLMRMRSVLAVLSGNQFARRKFYVAEGNLWATIASDGSAVIVAPYGPDPTDATGGTSQNWMVTYAKPEILTKRPHVKDTGLVDGTPLN